MLLRPETDIRIVCHGRYTATHSPQPLADAGESHAQAGRIEALLHRQKRTIGGRVQTLSLGLEAMPQFVLKLKADVQLTLNNVVRRACNIS